MKEPKVTQSRARTRHLDSRSVHIEIEKMTAKGLMVSRVPAIAWVTATLLPIAGWMILIMVTPMRMHALWAFHFADASRERLFVASLAFFVSFAVLRGITYSIHHSGRSVP